MSSDHTLRPLGRIARLQIQLKSPISGERPNRVYDPSPESVIAVEEMTLTPLGALVRLPDGVTMLDIHHAHHPSTKNDDNTNALSVNFTSHYDLMRAEFGGHLWDGSAGENILVETLSRVQLESLANGLAIQPRGGEPVWLCQVLMAHPCRPFSGFVMGGTEATVKSALQFLDHGMRGYYCALAQEQPVTIAVGDTVLVPRS